ncbi:MAG: three-Cys-motif partner protein TcmP [Planctomycetota bacterium]
MGNVSENVVIAESMQAYGGGWTEVKLEMLAKYLAAYTTALKNQPFQKWYIDAFAGTGYREIEAEENATGLFTEQAEAEGAGFFDGSVRKALQVTPSFGRYVFIEKSRKRMAELQKVSPDFPSLADKMVFRAGDANDQLPALCRETDWKSVRAVLFLDPFGANVDWSTMEAIARTPAIDVWVLFPVGIGINRMLKLKPADIPQSWQNRLDRVFGTGDWRDAFYKTSRQKTLFDEETITAKVGDPIPAIADYYQQRLKTIFPQVVSNPRYLCNSKGSPMFLFTFAVSNPNPKAQALAIRIAQHILGKGR